MEPKVIQPRQFEDHRGFFSELWNKKTCEKSGLPSGFVQDNFSFSQKAGTLRGLHAQYPPFAQAKLVWCVRGSIFDVVADIRKGSPRYGQTFSIELSGQNRTQLFVPEGFLHGFLTLEADTEVFYKCSNHYDAKSELIVRFDDPDLGIAWPAKINERLLSDRDCSAPFMADVFNPFDYEKIK